MGQGGPNADAPDNGQGGAPGLVQLAGDTKGVFSQSHAMQFVWPAVAPGAHTVTVQWKSFSGSSVSINKGALVVAHK